MINNRNKLLIISVATITLLSLAGVLYIKKIINNQAENLQSNGGENEHAEAGNITLTETQDGHKLWEITTEMADYDPKASFSNLKKLSGRIYTPDEKVKFEFTADGGRYFKETKSFELHGNAALNAPDSKITVRAGSITWAPKGEHIKAGGGVVLDKPGSARTSAGSASFSQDFSYAEFNGGVTTQISN